MLLEVGLAVTSRLWCSIEQFQRTPTIRKNNSVSVTDQDKNKPLHNPGRTLKKKTRTMTKPQK